MATLAERCMLLPDRKIMSQVLAVARMLSDEQIDRLATALASGSLELTAGALAVGHSINLPGSAAGTVVTLLRQWQSNKQVPKALATALLAARMAQNEAVAESPQVRLVWTGPVSIAVPARSTLSVLLELIDTAQQEIVIVGYALTEGAVIVLERLSVAQRQGIRVVLIGNRLEQRLDFIRTNWPANQPLPELYTRPISHDDLKSSLHAKVAIADQQRMLVTSANLTYHGLAGNVEIGVLVKSRDVSDVVYLFNSLIHRNLLLRV